MSYKIEPRDGAEVYVSDKGYVCIKQTPGGLEEQVLIFHREEVPLLIQHLQAVYQEALNFVDEPDDEATAEADGI